MNGTQENEITQEESTTPDPTQEKIAALEARVAALESVAHNTHSIAPETIEQIIKQAVHRVGRHLRTTSDILSVLE